MSFRPVLRAGLVHRAAEDGGVLVEDPPAGIAVRAGPVVAPLLRVLDGHLGLDDALRVAGVPRAEGERLVRSLAFTGLLLGVDEDGRRARVEARAAGAAHAERAPFRFAVGTRFECGACGACCTTDGVDVPLTRAEMDRLAGLAPGPLFVQRPAAVEGDPAERSAWFLARDARGACVLLAPSGACRVHEALGPEAKPLGCRLFPWTVRPTPDGVVVADSTRCATFSTSSAQGPPVYEAFDALRPVLREAARRLPVATAAVRLGCGVTVTEAHARLAVSRAVEALDARGGTWLEGAGAALGALANHEALVLEEPLGPGLPGRVIDRLWAAPLEHLAAGPEGAPSADAVSAALVRLMRQARAVPGAADDELVRRTFERAALETLAVAEDAEVDAALRRALRQRLHGLPLEAAGALSPCVAAAVVTTILTLTGAAALAGTTPRPDHLDAVQPRLARALRDLRPDEADAATLVHGGVALPVLLGRTFLTREVERA